MNCPHCDRLLYSRQHKKCGFCGEELPPEVLLSEYEVDELKDELNAIAERMAKAKAKEEEEKLQRIKDGGNFHTPGIPPTQS